MSLLDRVRLERSDAKRIDPFDRKSFDVHEYVEETASTRPTEFSHQDQFRLVLNIETMFWANKAQFESHMQSARKLLYAELYKDIRSSLDRLTHAVFNGDREDALNIISQLRKAVEP